MPIRSKVESDEFKGLRNPYTGEPVETEMVVAGDGAVYFHADPPTYTPSDPAPTKDVALHRWSAVDGVARVRMGRPIACAYTGEPLSFAACGGGAVALVGGFDPNMLHSRDEYLAKMHMRNGVANPRWPWPPQGGPRVEPVREKPPVRVREGVEPTEEAVRAADAATRAAGIAYADTVVSMHVPAKTGGKGGKGGKGGRRG